MTRRLANSRISGASSSQTSARSCWLCSVQRRLAEQLPQKTATSSVSTAEDAQSGNEKSPQKAGPNLNVPRRTATIAGFGRKNRGRRFGCCKVRCSPRRSVDGSLRSDYPRSGANRCNRCLDRQLPGCTPRGHRHRHQGNGAGNSVRVSLAPDAPYLPRQGRVSGWEGIAPATPKSSWNTGLRQAPPALGSV